MKKMTRNRSLSPPDDDLDRSKYKQNPQTSVRLYQTLSTGEPPRSGERRGAKTSKSRFNHGGTVDRIAQVVTSSDA
jgi:hypothetical protein